MVHDVHNIHDALKPEVTRILGPVHNGIGSRLLHLECDARQGSATDDEVPSANQQCYTSAGYLSQPG